MILIFIPLAGSAQMSDTARVLKRLSSDLKNITNLSYRYKMNVKFPNGDKDNMEGYVYLNTEDKIYYNDCASFTMLYSPKWLYSADHKSKTIEIVDLGKEKDKKLTKLREKEIFQNGALSTFLDSVLLKKGKVNKYDFEGNIYNIAINFPQLNVQRMSLSFDTSKGLLVSCGMNLSNPFDKVPSGTRYVNVTIECDSFKTVTDKTVYTTEQYFVRTKNKTDLKKYNTYKLIQL